MVLYQHANREKNEYDVHRFLHRVLFSFNGLKGNQPECWITLTGSSIVVFGVAVGVALLEAILIKTVGEVTVPMTFPVVSSF